MEKTRCSWVSEDKCYQEYHDKVWGRGLSQTVKSCLQNSAFMQAVGMLNDYTTDCFCYESSSLDAKN